MDIPTQDELLGLIEAFRQRHEMAETRFGREAVNNPAFLRGLRDGVSPTLETLGKVRDFMARVDAEAKVKAKLAVEPTSADESEEEVPLPFSSAPPGAASLPTSSSTSELQQSRTATGSSHCSTGSAEELAK